MKLIKLKDNLYVPEDFGKDHHYFADPDGKKRYTGITKVLDVLAKEALIGWAANMAVDYTLEESPKRFDEFAKKEMARELGKGEKRMKTYELFALALAEVLKEARTAHTRKKEAAGAHGTDAHSLVENAITYWIEVHGGRPCDVEKMNPAIRPFIDWSVENVDHFIFSERRMCDPTRFIAGTADFAAIMKDGKKLMGDFKTSSGIYGIDYWLQVAAYRMLAEGEGDEPYDGSVVVRLGKDGSFDVHYRYDYETDRNAFLACLTLYRAKQTWESNKHNK